MKRVAILMGIINYSTMRMGNGAVLVMEIGGLLLWSKKEMKGDMILSLD